jgi:transposase InsO family protein
MMCRVYEVSRAGYYAWQGRAPSDRAQKRGRLVAAIERVHAASGETYGSPRVTRALRQSGYTVSENRVARLMRERCLKARAARLYRANPANHAFFTSIPNRQLAILAQQPDQVWVGDITYLKVGTAWRYLAVVMDKWSRRIVGWSLGRHRYANLTLRALDRAVANRRPRAGLIFHTDRGIEYAAHAFRQRLAHLGFIQSMNRPQRMNDNAHMESFFHSLKSESIHGKTFVDDREAIAAVRSYLPYYNHSRLHSSLNYVSPATYEQQLA